MKNRIVMIFALWCIAPLTAAQSGNEIRDTIQAPDYSLGAYRIPFQSDSMHIEADETLPLFLSQDDSVLKYYRQSCIAYYTFKRNQFRHADRVFAWQLISSKIIFFVVIGLVLAGIWFASVQFYRGMKAGQEMPATNLELSAGSVKIGSSVLGLLILTLSIAFFYLYLVYVYPIEKI
ncbi:MAG TPA: hypothetical protein VGK59_14005 [Ohtaekwangia sp.]